MYALCRIGDWVKEEDVTESSRLILRKEKQEKRRALQSVGKSKPWWTSAAVDISQAPQPASNPRSRLNMNEGGMERRISIPQCELEAQPRGRDSLGPSAENEDPATRAQDPTIVLQDLCRHYLEALYLSRTSLAYFTKGPLSRARAAFAAMPDSAATVKLVDFLRESILSSATTDKKFKDGISSVVKDMAAQDLLSPGQTKKTKRKRKWKSKRDKHGLFTDEKDCIQRWWRQGDGDSAGLTSGEQDDAVLRRRLPKLRSRETFMQLILILEILALEASLPKCSEQNSNTVAEMVAESQAPETQKDDAQGDAGLKKPKAKKKKQDLSALSETPLDRLCIWHSLESHSPTKKSAIENDNPEETSDELKGFCVEVVIPFYISRVPDHAAVVNKKLGGPSAPSPVKRKTAPTGRPGEPATRPAPERKPRKPLARVATDTLNKDATRIPSLNRSATDTNTLSSYIKREMGEVPMESIPAANPQRKPRQSLMHTLDSSRRQVDLTAMSQANDAKLQKKAEMQQKMQSAINMLRKPNRAAALADIRNQTDENFAKATAAARSKPRQKTAQRSQVAATPSHGRAVKATPYERAARPMDAAHGQSSGNTRITSSSAGLAHAHETVPSSSFAIPQTGHRPRHSTLAPAGVEETPSRGFAKFMPAGLARQPGTLDSPTVSRKIAATPSKPVRSLSLVTATPASHALVAASPNVQRHDKEPVGEAPASKSIYDTLGWDEDEYEELS